jgi:hypothetical protein
MSVGWIKQKIIFVGTKNPIDSKKSILQPGMAIINICTLIAVFYCISSALLFYHVVENIFLAVICLPALLSLVTNNLILIQTKKIIRKTYIVLKMDLSVALSLFAIVGWSNIAYQRQLLNNRQIVTSYE